MSIKPGALRFNTDSMKLEIFRGSANYEGTASMAGIGTLAAGQWEEIQATSPEAQTGGTRGIHAGGFRPAPTSDSTNRIDRFNVDSTGNSTDFGDLTQKRYSLGAASSRTRGLFAGGRTDPSPTDRFNIIDYITIPSDGNAIDYGDLDDIYVGVSGLSNGTRGVFAGGYNPTQTDKIQYVTIESTGNAIDFGNLTATRQQISTCSNSVRGIFAGGQDNPGSKINTIEFITTSTLGNSADFGDLTLGRRATVSGGASNAVRGVFAGGLTPTYVNNIDYITISTLGNAQDFGDLLETNNSKAGCASPTRAVFSGGQVPATTNSIEYVQIMTTGNAVDFGDLTLAKEAGVSLSNGHGGL